MSDDDWVEKARDDDAMVAQLLLTLNLASPAPKPALPPDWTVRQPRSRPMVLSAKKTTTARASPTTPLSWSAATSLSGGAAAADGVEESSRTPLKPCEIARSKVIGASEASTSKRPKKRMTLNELKAEEDSLIKERKHLKRELATLRIRVEEQRATNDILTKKKLDLQSDAAVLTGITYEGVITNQIQIQQRSAAADPLLQIFPSGVTGNDLDACPKLSTPSSCCQVQKEVTKQETKFELPDLNLPLDDSEVL